MIEYLCDLNDVEIEIINHTEDKTYSMEERASLSAFEELVEDVLSVITVFSAKLYGSRSHKSKKIKETNSKLFRGDDEDDF